MILARPRKTFVYAFIRLRKSMKPKKENNFYGQERVHDHYSKFLNDTFVNDISHAEDDDDEDFNPNEFIDDLLDRVRKKKL